MKIIKVEKEKLNITLEITREELKYIWHRLNLCDSNFDQAYKDNNNFIEYKKLKCNIHTIWGIFNTLLK